LGRQLLRKFFRQRRREEIQRVWDFLSNSAGFDFESVFLMSPSRGKSLAFRLRL
jgi:hypothetical protein